MAHFPVPKGKNGHFPYFSDEGVHRANFFQIINSPGERPAKEAKNTLCWHSVSVRALRN